MFVSIEVYSTMVMVHNIMELLFCAFTRALPRFLTI